MGVGLVGGRKEPEPEIQRCKYWSRHTLVRLVGPGLPPACQLCENSFFLSRQEIIGSFGYFLGLELSQTVALDLGTVCPALHCGDVYIVLVSMTLSILDTIWFWDKCF